MTCSSSRADSEKEQKHQQFPSTVSSNLMAALDGNESVCCPSLASENQFGNVVWINNLISFPPVALVI